MLKKSNAFYDAGTNLGAAAGYWLDMPLIKSKDEIALAAYG